MNGESPPPSANAQGQAPRIPLTQCQRRLLLIWYIGAAPAFLVLIGQTFSDYYGTSTEQAWGWFLPNVLPTLLLVTGIVTQGARKQPTAEQSVERYYLRLALALSIVYLGAVSLALLYLPFFLQSQPEGLDESARCGPSCIEFLNRSNLFLGPFQGLVSAAMGAVFVTTK